MKKHPATLLVVITCVFAAFIVGFFVGRSMNRGAVFVSAVSTVPAHATSPTVTISTEPAETIAYPININTADADTLTALPGIGDSLAGRIVAYREAAGDYQKPEDLLLVNGIGPGKLEDILDLITTGG